MKTEVRHRQTRAPHKNETFSLPVSPYFQLTETRKVGTGRDNNSLSLTMKAHIENLVGGADDLSVSYFTVDNSGSPQSQGASIAHPTDFTDIAAIWAAAEAAILAQSVANGWGLSASDITKNFVIPADILRVYANPTLTLNTARQASTTRDAQVTISVEQATTLSLSGGQTCNAFLEYADDSGFTTNVKEIGRSTNGNTGTLAIGLNITQTNTATITGLVPANKYYRIRTTGTGTQTFRSAQEVLL